MAFIDSFLKQTAVYWPSPSRDGYGKLSFGTAVEIDVRWEDMHSLILNNDGKEELSKAEVFVDTDVEVDGYLYLGELSDLSVAEKADPQLKSTAFPIKAYDKVPDISGTDFVRTAWL